MTTTLDSLALPSGGLAMVAMDQRESLRTLFDQAGAGRVDDERMVAFKRDVSRVLGPLASGFLVDRQYGLAVVRDALPPTTGLLLAADALQQEPGGPVQETDLDERVVGPDVDLTGVTALKLLVVWRDDERRAARLDLARRFVAVARERGVLSVLEPVVRATAVEEAAGTWDREAAILEAAAEMSALGPDLSKVQVPLAGRGPDEALREACERLGRTVTGPWVVLSQGVERDDFPRGVEAACRAGASGFLAGRALWSDVVGRPDVRAALTEVAVPRLERLVALVEQTARPWRDA
ncbi:hypothetical protein [Cellulomonas sp. URHB0016]